MKFRIKPALQRGRLYAFPLVWTAVLATGVGFRHPTSASDIASFFSFGSGARSDTAPARATAAVAPAAQAGAPLVLARNDNVTQPDEARPFGGRGQTSGGHGRFAAPGNAARRVQLRAINPRTADELAGFFRAASYTLTDVRQGDAVPAIKVERVPEDLSSKDGNERKSLFITALLPVILEVNQQVQLDRDQLIGLRDRMAAGGTLAPVERLWLGQLAERYETSVDRLDELVRRVDIVPPSMAIAQSGVETGWGTSYAARAGNALFGQIQERGNGLPSAPWRPGAGMPQAFASVGEATAAYVINLNTHAAYAGFRAERAAMRARNELPNGFQLVGNLLRYSELGQEYVAFVRRIIRENDLVDFDSARLSSF